MNAIELLRDQHEEMTILFDRIRATNDGDEKKVLSVELADTLAAHKTIEERIFYPAAFYPVAHTECVSELPAVPVAEHVAMERIMVDLRDMKPAQPGFDATIEVLRDLVEQHVKEEEGEFFRVARRELGIKELERLGTRMMLLFAEQMNAAH